MGTQARSCQNCHFTPLPENAETCPNCGHSLAVAGGKLLPTNQTHNPAQSPAPAAQIVVNQQVGKQNGGQITGVHIDRIGLTTEEVEHLLERIQADFEPRPYSGPSPYLGLKYFSEQDALLTTTRKSVLLLMTLPKNSLIPQV